MGDLVCGMMVICEIKGWGYGLVKYDDNCVFYLVEYIFISFVFSCLFCKVLVVYVDCCCFFLM